MFKLNENYEVDRRLLKCDYIRYSPAKTSTINTPNSQSYINIPREDSAFSLLNSYLDLNFEVIKKVDESRYGNGNDIRLVNLGPVALTLTGNKYHAVIDKAAVIADARIKIDHIHWYVPHYTHSIQLQSTLSKQILSKTPTELRYVERSVFMKEVNNQNIWNFKLGSYENMNVPIWIIIGFQQRDKQDSQNLNNDTFCRLPVISAQCIIGTEKNPDTGILLNYVDDDYGQGYHQIKEAFRALTKDDILHPYISEADFRTSNVAANDIGYNLYVFDIRYQKNFTNSQPIKVEFKFDGVVPNDINGYALVLTKKLV